LEERRGEERREGVIAIAIGIGSRKKLRSQNRTENQMDKTTFIELLSIFFFFFWLNNLK
jgi:hypothetical protein